VPDIGYHFIKWSDDVTANPRTDLNVTVNVNVTASFATDLMTISGYVTEPDVNIPVEGVSIDATNGGGSDITDANGYYGLTVDYGWSGSVALSKTGYTFEPNGTEYSNVTTDQGDNYTAILDTFIISGYAVDSTLAPLAGVLVSPDNNGGPFTSKYYDGGSDTTDVNGYYEVLVDYSWSGNVVPSKYAYGFQPSSLTYSNVTEDKAAAESYAGTLLTYKITGYIKNECDLPIKDVHVDANNGGNSDITDANGYYEVWVSYNWSGAVTLSKFLYTFDPNGMSYTNVLGDIAENYVAVNIYDLDCSGYIGYGDVAVIGENWLQTGPNVPGDIHKDGDDIVNFLDFAEFAEHWFTRDNYTLSVNSSPSASGVNISSSTGHGGITNYIQTAIKVGTSVTLTAPATVGDLTFKGWTGAVNSSNQTISFSMTADKTVTANYELPSMVWVSINDPGVSGHEGFSGQMSKYETTNVQYCQFLNAAKASNQITVYNNVVYATSDTNHSQPYYNLAGAGFTGDGATNGGAARINYTDGSFTVDSGFEDYPVTYVSWYGATAFCNYYSHRLPTEWEWQAVADYDGSYTYGCGTTITNSIANYFNSTHPNGTTVGGAFGTYGYGMCDMAGNVYEWTSTVDSSSRIIRSGSWYSVTYNCLVSSKGSYSPSDMSHILGFRVCR
jgi:hypothetical protein